MKTVVESLRAMVCAAAALAGLLSAQPSSNPFDQVVAPLLIGEPMPSIKFVDQHGRPFSFSSARGQAIVAGFIYTRCNDVCPLVTQKFGRLDRMLGPGPYRLVEISIDAGHDTPGVLAAYARKYGVSGERWQLLTGNAQELQTFARAAGLAVVDNGRGELVHNARMLIVSPDGRLADVVQFAAWEPATVAAQLEHLAGAWSSPLARADFALTKAVAQFCGGSYQVASGVIDVVAALLVVACGVIVLLWMRRRLFAQGA